MTFIFFEHELAYANFFGLKRSITMPLNLAAIGEENIIKRIGGNADVRAHLQNLGFVSGAVVTVVSSMGGNLIVNVKGARVAISREMAQKIFI
jgi:ferrous iron transport protein A